MNWFLGITTIEALKAKYRELIKKHHPDRGGTNQDMASINLEYEKVFEQVKRGMPDQKKASQYDVNDGYREIIVKLLNLDGLIIELCGSWLWISGDTRKHKDTLKEFGCWWARKKGEWYWRPAEYKSNSRKSHSMEYIRNKFGSVIIEGQKEKASTAMPA